MFGPTSTVAVGLAEVVLIGWCATVVIGGHSVLGISRQNAVAPAALAIKFYVL